MEKKYAIVDVNKALIPKETEDTITLTTIFGDVIVDKSLIKDGPSDGLILIPLSVFFKRGLNPCQLVRGYEGVYYPLQNKYVYTDKTTDAEAEVKLFAEKQYTHAMLTDFAGDYIGFEFRGQMIVNPWLDMTGRFELTSEEAEKLYGKDNMSTFISRFVDARQALS